MTALRSLWLCCLIAIAASCNGIVIALPGYNEDFLPRNEDNGLLMFQGYMPSPGVRVRMQVRGFSSLPWTTLRATNAESSRTFADGGNLVGYFWRIDYTTQDLKNIVGESAGQAFIRFVDDSDTQVSLLEQVPSEIFGNTSCYFDARVQGRSVRDAASPCVLVTTDIRVTFNFPPPPPDCLRDSSLAGTSLCLRQGGAGSTTEDRGSK